MKGFVLWLELRQWFWRFFAGLLKRHKQLLLLPSKPKLKLLLVK